MGLIRLAKTEDLERILEIYQIAKKFMRATGNPNQWNGAYPDKETLINDISKNQLFVLETEKQLEAVFAMIGGADPTYSYIEGNWLNDDYYVTIHRIATSQNVHNVLTEVKQFALSYANNIRIDTHSDNAVMQHTVLKNGFKYCGIIYLENGDPRLAYQFTK